MTQTYGEVVDEILKKKFGVFDYFFFSFGISHKPLKLF